MSSFENTLADLKARTTRTKNVALTRAQIDRPVLAGKVIRRVTGGGSKKKGSGHHAPAQDAATTVPAVLTRTNGIEAAKRAAGVPTIH
jgi:hypothetical protein